MRLCVYTDYAYSQVGGVVYGQRAFVTFMCEVGSHFDEFVVLGRLDPREGRSRYPLPSDVRFVGLPFYESLTQPVRVLIALVRSLRQVWRELGNVDVVWLMGPYLHSFVYALLAVLRGRRIVLGVRQELVQYTRTRHPQSKSLLLAAYTEEVAWRLLARFAPTVVVGPSLADSYRHARSLLPVSVSLVRERDIVEPAAVRARSYDGEMCVLAVGRLDTEKNPLLLADILAELRKREPRWRLIVCGEGSLENALGERLLELDVAEHAELRGYIPFAELREVYRRAHAFLHVSWTEGVPQVLFESWAAALPVVATAVGGVPEVADGAALLIPPGDAEAAADALSRVSGDVKLRAELLAAGHARVRERTLEAEARRVVSFIRAGGSKGAAHGRSPGVDERR
jgi:glycosyltransferase involved in cell wall biosynthesis